MYFILCFWFSPTLSEVFSQELVVIFMSIATKIFNNFLPKSQNDSSCRFLSLDRPFHLQWGNKYVFLQLFWVAQH